MTRFLLRCGQWSSLLYFINDLAVLALWPAYDHAAQAVSELGALGAPTRPWMLGSAVAYDLLLVAFGLGVAQARKHLAGAGKLLVAIGAVGLVTSIVFPMHQRGSVTTFTDTMHIALTAVTVACIVAAMAISGLVLGGAFARASLAAIVVTLAFGALAGLEAPRLEAGLPTPWLGAFERISIGAYLLWVALLAQILLRRSAGRQAISST